MVIFQTTLCLVILTLAGVATWLGVSLIKMRNKMKFYRKKAIRANHKAQTVKKVRAPWLRNHQ